MIDRETLNALQGRDLSVNDYDILLGLDKLTPDLPTQLLLSLHNKESKESIVDLNDQNDSNQSNGSSIPSISSLCWCRRKNTEAAIQVEG